MTAITREMVVQRLEELKSAHMNKIVEAAVFLGHVRETELLLILLDKPEPLAQPTQKLPPMAKMSKKDRAKLAKMVGVSKKGHTK